MHNRNCQDNFDAAKDVMQRSMAVYIEPLQERCSRAARKFQRAVLVVKNGGVAEEVLCLAL